MTNQTKSNADVHTLLKTKIIHIFANHELGELQKTDVIIHEQFIIQRYSLLLK